MGAESHGQLSTERQRTARLHPDVEHFYRTAARIALAIAARTQQVDGAEAAETNAPPAGQEPGAQNAG